MINNKVKAVFEVGFHTEAQAPKVVLNDQITTLTEQFSMQLNHIQTKLSAFCKVNEQIIAKNRAVAVSSVFLKWKHQKAL